MAASARDPTDHLLTARATLRSGIATSRALAASLDRTTPRLDRIRSRLPALEAAIRPARAGAEALHVAGAHIDGALGPAAVVLRVFDAVHGLEAALLAGPRGDLQGYLSLVHRLEEALRLLGGNCSLAVQWLDDLAGHLRDNSVADDKYLARLSTLTRALRGAHESSPLDGGLMDAALDRLEDEFRRLLADNSAPLPLSLPPSPPPDSSSSNHQPQVLAPPPLPASVVKSLLAVLNCLAAHGRAARCSDIYADVRGSNLRDSLHALGLDYLDVAASELDGVQAIDLQIALWEKHLEFAVKHLLDAEYKLCAEVFDRLPAAPPDLWLRCFAEIADRAGFSRFLAFGNTVTDINKDPIKLLKLLDIFACLDRLRLDFNRLFGAKACADIQAQTRGLVKRVVQGACDIFFELLLQVDLQRTSPPPLDGGVPKLVSFMLAYCNKLLGYDCCSVLTQVLDINRSWRRERHQDSSPLLQDAILDIIKALERNCEAWADAYSDKILSHVFRMNTHCHFYNSLKGTSVGDLLGEPWLKEHEQCKEYYATLYLRESWCRLPALLSRDGLVLFSGGRATARDLVKKRFRVFNDAFDDMYSRHSRWVVPDKDLSEKLCRKLVEAVLPVYKSYMQNYGPLVENAGDARYIKYSVQSLENMLASIFSRKPTKSVSFRARHPGDMVTRFITSPYQSAPTVT